MGRRIELHELLCDVLASSGIWDLPDSQGEQESRRHVYFQPTVNIQLAYPCIIYSLSDISTQFADNISYLYQRRYTLTVIDRNPDSTIVDRVLSLPRCVFDRAYTADNLHHWAFIIYY